MLKDRDKSAFPLNECAFQPWAAQLEVGFSAGGNTDYAPHNHRLLLETVRKETWTLHSEKRVATWAGTK